MKYDLFLFGRWVGFQFANSVDEAISKYAVGRTTADGYSATLA